jgi:hypothetical protein
VLQLEEEQTFLKGRNGLGLECDWHHDVVLKIFADRRVDKDGDAEGLPVRVNGAAGGCAAGRQTLLMATIPLR